MDRFQPTGLQLAPAGLPDPGPPGKRLQLAELMGALSHALDMTEGQPAGHCLRACWVGMHIGREIGLSEAQQWELYYSLLLKDLGCSSNAARICELYLSDDLRFKRDFKVVGDSLPQMLKFVFSHTGLKASLADRLRSTVHILRHGPQVAQELIQTRCSRGATIARRLRFAEPVAAGIHSLDEHWNGQGKPEGLAGEAIPLYARIALLSQVIDVFHTADGRAGVLHEVRQRKGQWFDPRLVDAFEQVAQGEDFWTLLASPDVSRAVLALAPGQFEVPLDDDFLDDITAAFGQVVDSKSPYTSGHSERVAHFADHIACTLGISAPQRRWLKRAALLHDVGKLGVSNAILDKPGKLDGEEWAAMQRHAAHTEAILSRIGAFGDLARVAASHHERLDGAGYPRGLKGDEISLETRIITTADIFDALTADRPYRAAMPVPKALDIMAGMRGSAIDPLCLDALISALAAEG